MNKNKYNFNSNPKISSNKEQFFIKYIEINIINFHFKLVLVVVNPKTLNMKDSTVKKKN